MSLSQWKVMPEAVDVTAGNKMLQEVVLFGFMYTLIWVFRKCFNKYPDEAIAKSYNLWLVKMYRLNEKYYLHSFLFY